MYHNNNNLTGLVFVDTVIHTRGSLYRRYTRSKELTESFNAKQVLNFLTRTRAFTILLVCLVC